ncbi:acryloyl-CoA reductase [Paenibacillus sp. YYML68]|uniref:acrylyl-CoA reductase family protein n=1 Tax=Paenibacillus sp. YYML68 TaxID=2909250 RepID=UPI0024928ED6|nr:acryloyl-CoA reductase [Paenibacillus sp. YYML68]
MNTYRAYVLEKSTEFASGSVRQMTTDQLPGSSEDVTIRVHYSSLNYKDALAAMPVSPVVKRYPFVPGIDLAGTVIDAGSSSLSVGQPVLVTGYELGVTHDGGFSELARVPASWIVPLPDGLTPKEAMLLGTAGFTAALSVMELEHCGLQRATDRHVLVTGATGGVGSVAVSLLAKLGYQVTASSGKLHETEYLQQLGASEIIERDELTKQAGQPLLRERWAAAVDPVGGSALPVVLGSLQYGGGAAVSGLTGGASFDATVYPFILRGIKLLGIDSVQCPMEKRLELWSRLAGDWKPDTYLKAGHQVIGLHELPAAFEAILAGRMRGRVLVSMQEEA